MSDVPLVDATPPNAPPPNAPRPNALRDEAVAVPEPLLRPLLESAAEVLKDLSAEEVPALLRAITGFDRRGLTSGPARQQLRKAFDTDDGFRERAVERFLLRPEVQAVADRWLPAEGRAQIDEAAEREDLPLLASTLYARRPEGWEFGLGVACGAFTQTRQDQAEDADQQALRDRIRDLEEAARRAEAARDATRAASVHVEQELRDERRSRRAREDEAQRHAASADRRVDEHERALENARRQAEGAEARRRQSLDRARALEADLRTARTELSEARKELAALQKRLDAAPAPGSGLRQEDLRALVDAADLARKLADGLAGVADQARGRGRMREPAPSQADPPPPAARPAAPPRRTRRVTLGVPPGLIADSPEAIAAMLRTPNVAVVLDGYNVSMAAWPDLATADQRDRLLSALAQLALRTRAAVTVVFDGADVGPVHAVRRPGVRVVFSSADEKADPVVVREVAALPLDTPALVVSSDNWVREHAQTEGALVVASRAFLAALRA